MTLSYRAVNRNEYLFWGLAFLTWSTFMLNGPGKDDGLTFSGKRPDGLSWKVVR